MENERSDEYNQNTMRHLYQGHQTWRLSLNDKKAPKGKK